LQQNQFYPLLVQRLVHIIGREKQNRNDGKQPGGRRCRKILPVLCQGSFTPEAERNLRSTPVSAETSRALLEHSHELKIREAVDDSLPSIFAM